VQPFTGPYTLMLWIAGAGTIVDSLERLASLSKYRDGGVFSWVVLRQRFVATPSWVRSAADRVFGGSSVLAAVLLIRIFAVVLVCASGIGSGAATIGLTLIVAGQVYAIVRTGIGTIGADPMILAVCGAAWLATIVGRGSPLAARAGLWFIGGQACLGYAVAGVAKLASPKWRSGEAMTALLSTTTYGSKALFSVVRNRPSLSRAICWSVMLWEATFPAGLWAPDAIVVAQFSVGLLFHAAIAELMGLNLFMAAFPATYVAIWAIRN
jgi:hypothetical protein